MINASVLCRAAAVVLFLFAALGMPTIPAANIAIVPLALALWCVSTIVK